MTWRTGSKVPLNVYEGERPVCQCHSERDARWITAAVNFSRLFADGTVEDAVRKLRDIRAVLDIDFPPEIALPGNGDVR